MTPAYGCRTGRPASLCSLVVNRYDNHMPESTISPPVRDYELGYSSLGNLPIVNFPRRDPSLILAKENGTGEVESNEEAGQPRKTPKLLVYSSSVICQADGSWRAARGSFRLKFVDIATTAWRKYIRRGPYFFAVVLFGPIPFPPAFSVLSLAMS